MYSLTQFLPVRWKEGLRKMIGNGTPLHGVLSGTDALIARQVHRFIPWSFNTARVGMEITNRCNLHCPNCNRAVGQARSEDSISPEQMEKFVRESTEKNWSWKRIALTGGEPTLHPRFFEMLEKVRDYKSLNPDCEVAVVTNGHGREVREVLDHLPSWVTVKNSKKEGSEHEFVAFNLAPIDQRAERGKDFGKGCRVLEYCGLGLSRYGFYPCAPGACIDRVFGFDIGIKDLSSVGEAALRSQLRRLCPYCGFFRYNFGVETTDVEVISESWREAFEAYRRQKPSLHLY
jgi:hypothetical protein